MTEVTLPSYSNLILWEKQGVESVVVEEKKRERKTSMEHPPSYDNDTENPAKHKHLTPPLEPRSKAAPGIGHIQDHPVSNS